MRAAERQGELVRTLSEYVESGDPQADTVEAMLRDLDLALSVLEEAETRARVNTRCPDHVWCDTFQQGAEATWEMWRVWGGYENREGAANTTWSVANEVRGLTNRAAEKATGCTCLPWEEAEAAWRGVRDLSESEDASRLVLALARTREAVETCWQ